MNEVDINKADIAMYMFMIFVGSIVGGMLVFSVQFTNNPSEVSIPSPNQVRNFCESIGYDSGWVSTNCGANEVTCMSKLGDYTKFECVPWFAGQSRRPTEKEE